MNRNTLTRIATITAIIGGVSLLIAGVIGVASGTFQAIAAGTFRFNEAGRAGNMAVDEQKSLPIMSINRIAINAVSENITIREVSGDDITARFHGNISSTSPDDRPHLEVRLQGDTAEIRIERQQHITFGSTYSDAVLEVSIPKQYAGKLTAQGVSSDITAGSHHYAEVALKTISGHILAQDLTTERTNIYSVSGDVDMKAFTGDVDAHSISGCVALTFTEMPGSINIKTVSGDIRLGMPPNAGFALDVHSNSGGVTCDFPITITNSRTGGGEHSLTGTAGSGKGAITVRTVSGDIGIIRNGGV